MRTTKNIAITVPRAEIEQFERAVYETLEGAHISKTQLTLSKYLVTVTYPDWIQPKKFVELGTRFQELLTEEK